MYMVVRSVESRGPITQTKIRQPLLRAFKFKPVKSRSLVIKMGTVEDRLQFKIGNDTFPTVTEKPSESLGKLFSKTLSNREAIREMKQQLSVWVEKSGLPGKFKTQCYPTCFGHYWFMLFLLQQHRCLRR